MKKITQIHTLAILITSLLLLFSCSKKDDPKPDDIPLEVGGTLNAVVNGEAVNYTDVNIGFYGSNVGISGYQQVEEHRRDRLTVVIPLEPTTGTFNHNESPFFIRYEAIMGNSEGGAGFNREASGKISITEYKAVGEVGDYTYYHVKGTFERYGMNNFNSETIDIRNGEFQFTYKTRLNNHGNEKF